MTTTANSAHIRQNIRKYGGCLTVHEPLPCPLEFQIIEMKLLDPNEMHATTSEYNEVMLDNDFYRIKPNGNPQINDVSQVAMFGRTEAGNSICALVPFKPFCYMFAPDIEWTADERRVLHDFICRGTGLNRQDVFLQPEKMKRLYGWVPNKDHQSKPPGEQTDEMTVIKIVVPNKKMFGKLIDVLDPAKSFERICSGTLRKLKEDNFARMETYRYIAESWEKKIRTSLDVVDKRLKMIRNNIEKFGKDPNNLRSDSVGPANLPTDFECPSVETMTFQSPKISKLWTLWQEKHRAVYQHIAWWKQTGYKLNGIKGTFLPTLWETSVDMVHKFCDSTRIIPSGWVSLSKFKRPAGYISHCQIECAVQITDIKPIDKPNMAPLLIVSIDGEMYSPRKHAFPNPLRADNPVITIGVVLCRTNSPEMERFVFCLGSVDESKVTNATVFQFQDESELLRSWRDFITVHADPDFITGYNIVGFDWRYFAIRAAELYKNRSIADKFRREEEENAGDSSDEEGEKSKSKPKKKVNVTESAANESDETTSKAHIIGPLGMSDEEDDENEKMSNVSRFFRLSRIWSELTPCRPQVFKSDAYGERWSYHIDMTGRAIQDLLIYVRRSPTIKLESYKLDDVAFYFLKDRKIDLGHELMFKYYETGPAERGLIAEYCLKDCVLPIDLCKHNKLMVVENLVEMSRVTITPMTQIINRGQQIKVFNQLVWYAHLSGFVMNDQPHREVIEYEGATVLDPMPGWYNTPITVLDFMSLYPSIIINQNLCYSTFVLEERYKNLPGIRYNVITTSDGTQHTFVHQSVVKGILPKLEEHLLTARRNTRKMMKTEKDKNVYAMLDARQLAIKVSCNSVYGFTAANMYPEPSIAESITATGRRFIESTRKHILDNYAFAQVIYGDSVTGETPLLLRIRSTGMVVVRTIERLWFDGGEDIDSSDKQYIDLENVDTWTEQGWTPVDRIMRHRTTKPIVRVITETGIVDVTEDHSLLRSTGEPVKPNELTGSDKLMSSFPTNTEMESKSRFTPAEAKVMGFFLKNGNADNNDRGAAAWCMFGTEYGMLEPYVKLCKELYPDVILHIDDTSAPFGVYNLVAEGNNKGIAKQYLDLFYDEKWNKVLPDGILSSDATVRQAFFDGYLDAIAQTQKGQTQKGHMFLDVNSQDLALGLFALIRSLGMNCSISNVHSKFKQNLFRITMSSDKNVSSTVQRIVPSSSSGWVYDLTTRNGHFHAGAGSLIVHNTDSVFIKFKVTPDQDGMVKSFELGRQAAAAVSQMMGEAVTLDMEKVYFPLLLYGKKKYIGLKFENLTDPKLDMKGVEIVRRDWSPLVKTIYKKCIDEVFLNRNVPNARKMVQTYCADMIDGKLDPKYFVMSKELKTNYANPESQVHVAVVKRIAQRTPGAEPQPGDRVPYVMIRTKNRKAKACEKSEDPEYVRTHNIKLDYEYYLEKQLMKPLSTFFEMFKETGGAGVDLFANVKRIIHNEATGVGRDGLMAYFSKSTLTTDELDPFDQSTSIVVPTAPPTAQTALIVPTLQSVPIESTAPIVSTAPTESTVPTIDPTNARPPVQQLQLDFFMGDGDQQSKRKTIVEAKPSHKKAKKSKQPECKTVSLFNFAQK